MRNQLEAWACLHGVQYIVQGFLKSALSAVQLAGPLQRPLGKAQVMAHDCASGKGRKGKARKLARVGTG